MSGQMSKCPFSVKCPEKVRKLSEKNVQMSGSAQLADHPDQCLQGVRPNVRTNVQMSGQTIRLLIRAQLLGLFDGPAISPLKSVCTCRDIHGSHRVTMHGLSIMSVGVA